MNDIRPITIVVCGAGPAPTVGRLIAQAQHRGYSPTIVATPNAVAFLDIPTLEHQTGQAVRSQHRQPDTPRTRRPPPQAVIVAPATANTICKLAHGIADNYALDTITEAIGAGTPTVILPFVNTALAARTPFTRAVQTLRDEHITVLFGPGQWEPHLPGTGDTHIDAYPWTLTLDTLHT